jgi:hypothetical protein
MLLLALTLAHATPIQLTHQGRVLDASGSPPEDAQTLTVSLFDGEDSTDFFWSDDFAVDPSGGYYSVVLGSGAVLDTSELYRPEVWVEVSAGVSMGRQQLLSVPYAAVARSVDGGRGRFDGAVTLGTEEGSFCTPETAGSLVWDTVNSQVQVCDGDSFGALGGQRIVLDGAARRWSDGTFARSCKGYRTPGGLYEYSGDVGTGVYTIDPSGNGTGFEAYCDMDFDGGGWTNVGYNVNRSRTFLTGTWSATSTNNPVTPTDGLERAINPEILGIAYSEMAFYIDDPQWTSAGRSYTGWWKGADPASTYQITSNTCQLLERTDVSQWSGQLVYFAGDGANDNGCGGGGAAYGGHTCDDGGGGVTTNNSWPTNGGDGLWGYNCISSYSPTGAYKGSPITNQGEHSYWVR